MEAAAAAVAAEQVVSTTVEAGVAYGVAKPTPSHTATFSRLASKAFLPRVNHSLTVVRGKAYIFGGEDNNTGGLAGDEIHIIALPFEDKSPDASDYRCLPSLGQGPDGATPGKRAGHTAVAVENRIYVFGGRGDKGLSADAGHNGRIWVFDTESLGWRHLDPDDSLANPPQRYRHSAAGTDHPIPGSEWTVMEEIANMVTQTGAPVEDAKPYGTIIIHGGLSFPSHEASLDSCVSNMDTWAYDIGSNTWNQLPALTSAASLPTSSFTFCSANTTLYAITSASDFSHDVHTLALKAQGRKLLPHIASAVWSTTTIPTNPLTPGPVARTGAPLLPITTGAGRLYLAYLMGERLHASSSANQKEQDGNAPEMLSDCHLYGLPAPWSTAAGVKDAVRSAVNLSTPQQSWEEVDVNTDVNAVQAGGVSGGTAAEGKLHPGPRAWMAADLIDLPPQSSKESGHGVVLWGGKNAGGEIEGDGWIVSIT